VQEAAKGKVVRRLARIEGQVRGLQRMIQEGRDCEEVLLQVSAALRALRRAGALVAACSMQERIASALRAGEDPDAVATQMVDAFAKVA
jgi:DNA-binding FrmR family transcriptional regulator